MTVFNALLVYGEKIRMVFSCIVKRVLAFWNFQERAAGIKADTRQFTVPHYDRISWPMFTYPKASLPYGNLISPLRGKGLWKQGKDNQNHQGQPKILETGKPFTSQPSDQTNISEPILDLDDPCSCPGKTDHG